MSSLGCIVLGKMALLYTYFWQSDVSLFPCYRLSVTLSLETGSQAQQVPYLRGRGHSRARKPSIFLSHLYFFVTALALVMLSK